MNTTRKFMPDCMKGLRVLFGVVADSSRATQMRFLASVYAVEATSIAGWTLDWAVLAYDDDVLAWQGTQAALKAAHLERARLINVLDRAGHHVRAKHVHQETLLNYSISYRGSYDVVWFLDGDISLSRLDLQALLRRWRCAPRDRPTPHSPDTGARFAPSHSHPSHIWWRRPCVGSLRRHCR